MYKAVIFDLDGTLLDTLKDIALSTNEVLKELGKPEKQIEEYNYLVGEGALSLMKNAMPNEDESVYERALELFKKHYAKQYDKNTKMYKDINKVLTFFSVRGYKMGVLSNKPNTFTKKCVLKYLRAWRFDSVYGARDDVPKKPDAKGALDIVKELNVKSEECLFVGDTKVDMQTAVNAGMTPIGVLWGFRSKQELLDNGAKYIVKEPSELIKLMATIECMEKNNG